MKKLIKDLIQETNRISNYHSKIEELKGDRFNIFKTLGIETEEVLTHSRFIAELLNPKGSHGKGSKFLKIFINVTNIKTKLEFDNSEVHTESYQGKVTETTGGYIDILIKDFHGNSITIENKVYAVEGKNQLLRYYNSFPKGDLLYLTLFGSESSQTSSKYIKYKPISYEKHILLWLRQCYKESVNTPNLRETLRQYIYLIQELTNQNSNSEMEYEIIQNLLKSEDNFQSYIELSRLNIVEYLLQNEVEKFIHDVANNLELELNVNLLGSWPSFTFLNDKMKKKNVFIDFSSSSANGIYNMVFGFLPLNKEFINIDYHNELQTKFNNNFEHYKGSGYNQWICLAFFEYRNWSHLDVIKDIYFNSEKFKNILQNKIIQMLSIL